MSPYTQVFWESVAHAQIVPLSTHAMLLAMREFGGYNMRLAGALALAGSMAGELVNWLAGRVLSKLQTQGRMHLAPETYAKAQRVFRYFLPLLLFSWWGLGSVFVLAAGFLRVRLWITLLLVAAGYAGLYGVWLYS